jgi:hypothetical protein
MQRGIFFLFLDAPPIRKLDEIIAALSSKDSRFAPFLVVIYPEIKDCAGP